MNVLNAMPPHRFIVESIMQAALTEDLGLAGDITSNAIIPSESRLSGAIVARQYGIIAGVDAAIIPFRLLDPALRISIERPDGSQVSPGEETIRFNGPARPILTAERVALNIFSRLSGIATATATLIQAARPHGSARIVCTRKTTPGLRALEKYAVRVGGGSNHRFGLDDAILIKDNHIAIAGSVKAALERTRSTVGHLLKVEIEVDTLDQLEEALSFGVDAVLLDNMDPQTLSRAVRTVGGRAVTEASGRITVETVGAVAASGVDLISVGWITHSAPILDLGLDVKV